MEMNTLLYYQSARALKMPLTPIDHIAGFDIRLGKQRYFFRSGQTPFNCDSSATLSSNKYCANKVLTAAGFPVPKAEAFSKSEFKKAENNGFKTLSFPLVVKPTMGTALGTDVLCNITDMEQLKAYMNKCFRKHKFLTIEEFHPHLNSYRVLVFYNKVIGVVQRYSARIVGDGIHSIEELINLANQKRKELKKTTSLGLIKINDEEILNRLKELGLMLHTIPKDKEEIMLCHTCNSTRGGTIESMGKKICKENARLLCRAAKTLNLNLVGFDVLCEDILIPLEKSRGVIIEANQAPDVTIHEHPLTGSKNPVTKRILWRLILKHPISYILRPYQYNAGNIYFKISLATVLLLGCLSLIR